MNDAEAGAGRKSCARCGVTLEDCTSRDGLEITRGICPDCRAGIVPADRRELETCLDRIHAPVVMLDDDGVIVFSNERAATLLGTSPDRVRGARSGDVLECVRARLPGGCGRTEHCGGCTLRRSVMETFSTGEASRGVSCDLTIEESNPPKIRTVVISTERIADVVLLRFDRIEGEGPTLTTG